MVLGAGSASGQKYPNKPIRMVTAEIGGGADFTTRLVALGLTGSLGRQVIVDNRGIAAMEIVANAPPDGYTLISYGSPMWLAPFTRERVAWDPVKDFAPITLATNTPNILVVHPSVPAKSVQELVALAKARPGTLNYAAGSPGATSHLGAESFKSMAGIDIVRVSYKGNGPALNAVLANEVQMMFANVAIVTPLIKAGRLKGLAITALQPSALAPGVPTVASAGLPGFELVTSISVFAPAGTPAAIIKFLNDEIVRVLHKPDIKEKFFNSGIEVAGGTSADLAATVKSEMAQYGKIIKDAGIRAD